jgi:hypothetical protein
VASESDPVASIFALLVPTGCLGVVIARLGSVIWHPFVKAAMGRGRGRSTVKVPRDAVAVVKMPWIAIDRFVLLFFTTDEALIGGETAA